MKKMLKETDIVVIGSGFRATLDEYNNFCEKGHDDLFAKNPKYLRPLKGPRFYAIRSYMAFFGTLGRHQDQL